jgi:hypothetical protein
MLALLVAGCLSVFIPYSATSTPFLADFNISYQAIGRPTGAALIALVYSDTEDNATIASLVSNFTKGSLLFQGYARFVTFKSSNVKDLFSHGQLDLPVILYVTRTVLRTLFPFPPTVEGFLFTLLRTFSVDHEVATSVPELLGSLGDYPITIITKLGYGRNAMEFLRESHLHPGNVDVVSATDAVLNETGLNDTLFGLYRRVDGAIVPIGNNFAGFTAAQFPFFSLLTRPRITRAPLVAAYIDDKYNETLHSALYDLGERYPQFQVGVIELTDLDLLKELNYTTGAPDFVVFSLVRRSYYPPSNLSGVSITDPNWQAQADQYLGQIANGTIEGIYPSEPINNSEPSNVTKVVGQIYGQFIDDPGHDVVIFYREQEGDNETQLEVFREVANEVIQEGIKTYKFGYINYGLNSPRDRVYPDFVNSPHIEMFPAKNKTQIAPLFGFHTKAGVMRFLKEYGSLPNELDPDPLTILDAINEFHVVRQKIQSLPPGLARMAMAYAERLEGVMNGSARPTAKPSRSPPAEL